MAEQSEITTIVLALIDHAPAILTALSAMVGGLFAYLSLRASKRNAVAISDVQKEARETTATVNSLANSDFSNR